MKIGRVGGQRYRSSAGDVMRLLRPHLARKQRWQRRAGVGAAGHVARLAQPALQSALRAAGPRRAVAGSSIGRWRCAVRACGKRLAACDLARLWHDLFTIHAALNTPHYRPNVSHCNDMQSDGGCTIPGSGCTRRPYRSQMAASAGACSRSCGRPTAATAAAAAR